MNRFNRLMKKRYRLYEESLQEGVIISKFLSLEVRLLTRLIRLYYHCDIPYCIDVSGVYFCHKGFGIVINPKTVFGKDVVIQHCVTIGEIGMATPIIGNNVFIGAKSTIIGGVKIGNNVKIGAGAVVISDVPEGCTAVGVPAKVIRPKND